MTGKGYKEDGWDIQAFVSSDDSGDGMVGFSGSAERGYGPS